MSLTNQRLANILGVSTRTVTGYRGRGMPTDNARSAKRWVLDNIGAQSGRYPFEGATDDGDDPPEDPYTWIPGWGDIHTQPASNPARVKTVQRNHRLATQICKKHPHLADQLMPLRLAEIAAVKAFEAALLHAKHTRTRESATPVKGLADQWEIVQKARIELEALIVRSSKHGVTRAA